MKKGIKEAKLTPISIYTGVRQKGILCQLSSKKKEHGFLMILKDHLLYPEIYDILGETDLNGDPFNIDVIIKDGKVFTKRDLLRVIQRVAASEYPTDQTSVEKLLGQYKIELQSSSKERKRLLLFFTVEKKRTEIKFDVRVINTHHTYDNIEDAINKYNSI